MQKTVYNMGMQCWREKRKTRKASGETELLESNGGKIGVEPESLQENYWKKDSILF